jgi:3-phenylpropionate/trans-cinnamate dioxygenase ferredoxin reductase subunit
LGSGNPFVIVGSGQAGGWAAKTLRQEGYEAPIVMVGDEPHPPYERPPLSKAVLLGTAPPQSTHLFPTAAWDELAV